MTTIEISQPVTLITDYILSLVVLIFGISLFRARNRTSGTATLLWSVGFLTAAAAAAAGGTFHGFAYYFSAPMHRSLWRVTLGLITASAGFVALAVLIQSEVTDGQKRWLRAGILLTFVGVVIQRGGFSPAANFNHNDLYHCIQTMAFYLLFRAALPPRWNFRGTYPPGGLRSAACNPRTQRAGSCASQSARRLIR